MTKTPIEKLNPIRIVARLALGGLLGLLLVGCSTGRASKGNAAAVSLQRAAAEVQAESNAVELAMKALNELQNEPGGDLRQPFRHYGQAVDRLESAARKTAATGNRMAQRNTAYLAAWDKTLQEIDYEHIRQLSETRKGEVSQRFQAVNQKYRDSQEAVQPLIAYFRDIRTALSTDLTAGGIQSLKEIAENAGRNASKVQTALATLHDELTASGIKLSSIVPQQETAKVGQ